MLFSAEERGACRDLEVSTNCWIVLCSLTQGLPAFQQMPVFVASWEAKSREGEERQ